MKEEHNINNKNGSKNRKQSQQQQTPFSSLNVVKNNDVVVMMTRMSKLLVWMVAILIPALFVLVLWQAAVTTTTTQQEHPHYHYYYYYYNDHSNYSNSVRMATAVTTTTTTTTQSNHTKTTTRTTLSSSWNDNEPQPQQQQQPLQVVVQKEQQQDRRAPQWMYNLMAFRQRIFLVTVEPIIVALLGPVVVTNHNNNDDDDDKNNTTHEKNNTNNNNNNEIKSKTTTRDWEQQLVPKQQNTHNDHEKQQYHNLHHHSHHHSHSQHRRLNFLPSYISNVEAFHETSMSFATLIMLFVTFTTCFLVFLSCFYHNQKTSPLFVSPRRHRLPKLVPPPLPVNGYFAWIKICFYLSDEEIIHRIGYDSLIFLRFHRLALRCIVKMSVFSCIVLLPINFTGGGHANAQDLKGYVGSLFFTDFLRFTMANVMPGSMKLWIHCFAAYLLTGIVVRELLIEYETFNSIRHRYLLSREPHLRTVLVTNIPRNLRSSRKITSYFQHVYPNHAVKVRFLYFFIVCGICLFVCVCVFF